MRNTGHLQHIECALAGVVVQSKGLIRQSENCTGRLQVAHRHRYIDWLYGITSGAMRYIDHLSQAQKVFKILTVTPSPTFKRICGVRCTAYG